MLGANVTAYNPQTRALMGNLRAGFMAHGAAAGLARRQSYVATFGIIERQATILSYIDVFQLLALIFLLMVPLVLIMKRPSHGVKPAAAH
jgi:MFS transporter, DHA2 family, multidrug resistance protein